jgi:hypothetical protein
MGLDGEPDPPKLIPSSHSIYVHYSTNYTLTTPYVCCALNFKLKHSRIEWYHFGFIFTLFSFLITNLWMLIPKYVE